MPSHKVLNKGALAFGKCVPQSIIFYKLQTQIVEFRILVVIIIKKKQNFSHQHKQFENVIFCNLFINLIHISLALLELLDLSGQRSQSKHFTIFYVLDFFTLDKNVTKT